jgi:hypothetical protein
MFDQERLLRKLVLVGVLREDTARQETYNSIVSVIRVDRVRGWEKHVGVGGRLITLDPICNSSSSMTSAGFADVVTQCLVVVSSTEQQPKLLYTISEPTLMVCQSATVWSRWGFVFSR